MPEADALWRIEETRR